MQEKSLQERYAPSNACFGCGPANERGLRIRSFQEGSRLVARWSAEPHHQAFAGVVNGGIIGALLDCHSNWCAAMHLMETTGADSPPGTVTASFSVKLTRPTPLGPQLLLEAQVKESTGRRVAIEATLSAEGKVCATCLGVFVAAPDGHPAYHRW